MQLKRFQSFCLAAILSGFTAHAADQALIQLEIEQTPLSLPEKDTRTMALELQRPSNQDILFLSNGDKLTGTILNESLGIRTDFGTLKFSNQVIEGEDVRMMVKVNNRLSGFLEDRMIQFRLQFGPQIQIRSEKILTAVFGLRATERQQILQHQFIVAPDSLYHGFFQPGDVVAALNGEKYRPGTLTPLREKVVAGRIARILLKLKRGNQELYYSIMR